MNIELITHYNEALFLKCQFCLGILPFSLRIFFVFISIRFIQRLQLNNLNEICRFPLAHDKESKQNIIYIVFIRKSLEKEPFWQQMTHSNLKIIGKKKNSSAKHLLSHMMKYILIWEIVWTLLPYAFPYYFLRQLFLLCCELR